MLKYALWASIIFLPALLAQSNPTEELLRRVSETYAKLDNYVIDIQHVISDSRTGEGSLRIQPTQRLRLARAGDQFLYRMISPSARTWLTDGKTEVRYLKNATRYTQRPAVAWPAERGPGRELYNLEWQYVGRFHNISTAVAQVSRVEENVAPDKVCPFSTMRVTLRLGEESLPVIEQLRIDPSTALVCQRILSEHNNWHGHLRDRTTTTEWRYRQTSGPVEATLLTFQPPKNARVVKNLEESTDWQNTFSPNMVPNPSMPTWNDRSRP